MVHSLLTEACVGLLSLSVGKQKRRLEQPVAVDHLQWDPLCDGLEAGNILLGVFSEEGPVGAKFCYGPLLCEPEGLAGCAQPPSAMASAAERQGSKSGWARGMRNSWVKH